MKASEFATTLKRLGRLISVVGSPAAATGIEHLVTLFETLPKATVADIAKKLMATRLSLPAGRPSADQTAVVLAEVSAFLDGSAKAALLTDLKAVEALLGSYGPSGVAQLVEAAPALLIKPTKPKKAEVQVRHDLIDAYAKRLEVVLGDEHGFVSLFNEIAGSSDIGKVEAAEIAKRFAGKAGASKPASLKKIWSRHHSLMTFRAKSESRAGRSAA